ncbi:hypothetical protein [Chryseobacterium sp.]|uniref:hypothetical protein n=1 Tax=Chryseobacterium sp. TaxID=1871047 RepID=UPI00289F509F|nr:hypothetical protein [Chryseobacterium sp.]
MVKYLQSGICFVLVSAGPLIFAQQKVSGKITGSGSFNINPVLIINISNNQHTQSDDQGNFEIDVAENDEIRFVKEGYYRFDKKISKEDLSNSLQVSLQRMEIQIPEVKITYKLTGNLAKDNQHLNESGKIRALKSEMSEYMYSPLNEPLPDNTISKTFKGHDFKTGNVDIMGVFKAVTGLIKKASKPKITKANYNETQDFLNRVKNEINLNFLKKYGMSEEQIDTFLLYANKTRLLAKKYRKDFKNDIVKMELMIAFAEYRKMNKLSDK